MIEKKVIDKINTLHSEGKSDKYISEVLDIPETTVTYHTYLKAYYKKNVKKFRKNVGISIIKAGLRDGYITANDIKLLMADCVKKGYVKEDL